MCSNDICAFRVVCQKVVYLAGSPIEDCDRITMVVHVEHQVLTHHGEPYKADVSAGLGGHVRWMCKW